MGGVQVEVAVVLGVAVVLVVAVAAVVRRRRNSEAQSVAGYRQTLDVLGHLGGAERGVTALRTPPPRSGHPAAVRGTARGDVPHTASRTTPRPAAHALLDAVPDQAQAPGPLTAQDRGGAGRHAGFDDPGTDSRLVIPIGSGDATARRDRSLLVMERPARRLGAPLAVLALVLAAGGVAAYLLARSHHATPPRQATSSHSHRHTPPTTTLPSKYTAVSSTGSSVTYAPATSTYSLTIGATTSDCWMSVTSSTGTTVLAQTFAAGATASLSLTGHSTIVIGAPGSAKVAIGDAPVVLPGGAAGPLTVTLVPG